MTKNYSLGTDFEKDPIGFEYLPEVPEAIDLKLKNFLELVMFCHLDVFI